MEAGHAAAKQMQQEEQSQVQGPSLCRLSENGISNAEIKRRTSGDASFSVDSVLKCPAGSCLTRFLAKTSRLRRGSEEHSRVSWCRGAGAQREASHARQAPRKAWAQSLRCAVRWAEGDIDSEAFMLGTAPADDGKAGYVEELEESRIGLWH